MKTRPQLLRWGKPRRIDAAAGLVDPYFDWSSATKFAYYGKREWLPVLLELNGLTVDQFRARRVVRSLGSRNLFHLSPLAAESAMFCAAFVRENFVQALTDETVLGGMIKRFELSRGAGPFQPGEGE